MVLGAKQVLHPKNQKELQNSWKDSVPQRPHLWGLYCVGLCVRMFSDLLD